MIDKPLSRRIGCTGSGLKTGGKHANLFCIAAVPADLLYTLQAVESRPVQPSQIGNDRDLLTEAISPGPHRPQHIVRSGGFHRLMYNCDVDGVVGILSERAASV